MISTYALSLEILNSAKKSSKRKETVDIKQGVGVKTVKNLTQEG